MVAIPSYWDTSVMQSELSPAEKELRDKFVDQYLIDMDQVAAAMRIGFMRRVALTYSAQFMDEPYVVQRIADKQRAMVENPKEEAKKRKVDIEASLWREAHYRGPDSSHSARVSALAKLCNINDMDGTAKVKSEVTHRGGVMLVPAIASVDDWEKAATASQEKLISEARH